MTDTHVAGRWDAIIALGSNVGDKAGNISHALRLLTDSRDIEIVERSRDFRTPPWGILKQDWFVNACVSVATRLPPRKLLVSCLAVEDELGRVRLEKWGPRIIDVDVLVYRDVVSTDPELTLPHPRITERAFVLAPLADIAPDLEIGGCSVRDWLRKTDCTGVLPLPETE
jgi:2-amino-4-hydroxy-6-hydroxymethyldihydropteridine diphosphokinase